jgi:hypothetical protein
MWRVAANVFSPGQLIGGGPAAWRLGRGLTTLHRKKDQPVTKCSA